MRLFSDYLFQKASLNRIPLSGTFELSPVCNFSCKMCYVRRSSAQLQKEGKQLIPWTQWLSLAKQCKEAGMLYLLLTGGEPFLYPGFRKLYEELHKMGFLLSINSNGTMVDEKTVEWLKTMAPSRINITLYGASANTYERICGCADGYQRATKAIDLLKEAGIPLCINASMIPENAEDLEQIITFGRSRGINTRVSTYMFPPARRTCEETDSRFTPQEAAQMYLRKNRCFFGKDYPDFLNQQLEKIHLSPVKEDVDWGTDREYMRCRAGRCSFWVSWEGVMSACGMLPFPLEVYPFQRPFIECWNALTEKVRNTHVLKECNHCEKKGICNPCVAMLYTETQDVQKKAPYLCEMSESIIQGIKEERKHYDSCNR